MNSEIINPCAQSAAMPRPKKQRTTPTPYRETGERVIRLRKALGETNASAFAARMGMSPSNLANIESGTHDLSKHTAIKLCNAVPGLTTDYLLMGRVHTLGYDLQLKFVALAKAST